MINLHLHVLTHIYMITINPNALKDRNCHGTKFKVPNLLVLLESQKLDLWFLVAVM